MATSKVTLRNTAVGIRGVNLVGGYRDLAPGETLEGAEMTADELASAKSTGYFEFGKAATAEPESTEPKPLGEQSLAELKATAEGETIDLGGARSKAEIVAAIEAGRKAKSEGGIPPIVPPIDELDKMDDATLGATVEALTGKPAPEGASRDDLLALARG